MPRERASRRRSAKRPNSSIDVSPAPPPVLPPEVMGCIARAALAAEGDGLQAWARLSRVCRIWRDTLRGASSARTRVGADDGT